MQIKIDTMADGSEIVHYDHPGIPLYIRKGILSYYPGRRAQCHWHDDIELIQILDGEMNYYINGEVVPLRKGDGILINTREMHYGYSNHGNDCIFICILFHTTLLSPCKEVAQNMSRPFYLAATSHTCFFRKKIHRISATISCVSMSKKRPVLPVMN